MSLRYIDEPLGEEPEPAPQPRQLRPRYLPENDGPPKRPRIPESAAGLPSYQQDNFAAGWVTSAWSGPSPSVSRPPVSDHQWGMAVDQTWSAPPRVKDRYAGLTHWYPATATGMSAFMKWYLAQRTRGEPDQPDGPRERALQQQRNRNTGPNRDITRQKRPRRSK